MSNFEKITCCKKFLLNNGFKTILSSNNQLLHKLTNKHDIFFMRQKYFKYFLMNIDANYNKVFRNPDESFIKFENGIITSIYILEKKEQNSKGSYENIIWTGPSIKREYEIVFDGINIYYGFCLNDYFKNKIKNNKNKWAILPTILNESNIPIFFPSDVSYYKNLLDWVQDN